MKRIFLNILSVVMCATMLILCCSCSSLDEKLDDFSDTPSQTTTQTPVGNENPEVKYNRADLKYTFLTIVEGFEQGVPAQISYSVMDTENDTLHSIQIPANTFVSGNSGTLARVFKDAYNLQINQGRTSAMDNACQTLMNVLKSELLLPCDYYICFDKNSFSALVDEIGNVSVKIPFEMRFNDSTVIKSGENILDGENLWRVMCYDNYSEGCELNAAKMLWATVFYKLSESVTSDTMSLFMMTIRSNLLTNIPRTNGVDIFFLRNLVSIDVEQYKFASADVRNIIDSGRYCSVICKSTFLAKINVFLAVYDVDIHPDDFDAQMKFTDNSSAVISDAYNSSIVPTVIYTAFEAKNTTLYIIAK